MRATIYTVQRVRKTKNKFYGPVHAADNDDFTVCGLKIKANGTWYILSNVFDGEVTCKKCLKILRNPNSYIIVSKRSYGRATCNPPDLTE